jgi:serine protease inhibitor
MRPAAFIIAISSLFHSSGASFAAEQFSPERILESEVHLSSALVAELSRRAPPGTNIVISPASIAGLMALVDVGADAKMHAAIFAMLGLESAPNRSSVDSKSLRSLILKASLASSTEKSTLTFSNAVLMDPASKPYDGALSEMRAMGAEISLSPINNPAAIKHINDWAAKRTKGRILSILGYEERKPGLIAVNALYFEGLWSKPFPKLQTHLQKFHGTDSDLDVPMMSTFERFNFRREGRFVAVELRYGNGRYRLVIVTTTDLPSRVTEFNSVARWIDGIGFDRNEVHLSLPRFTLEDGGHLLDTLRAIGLDDGGSQSAFEKLSEIPLELSDISQKTYVRVDEKGTEAAAVTSIELQVAAERLPETIVVDRPFLFGLRDKETGLMLASGYVNRPATERIP